MRVSRRHQSAGLAVLLLCAGALGVGVAPTAGAAAAAAPTVTPKRTVFTAGDQIVVSLAGFTPGPATLSFAFPDESVLGRAQVGANGAGTITGTIPTTKPDSSYNLQVSGAGGEAVPLTVIVGLHASGSVVGHVCDVRDEWDASQGFRQICMSNNFRGTPNTEWRLTATAADGYSDVIDLGSDSTGGLQGTGVFVYLVDNALHWHVGESVTFTLKAYWGGGVLVTTPATLDYQHPDDPFIPQLTLSSVTPRPGDTVQVTGTGFGNYVFDAVATASITPTIPAGAYQISARDNLRGSFTVPIDAAPGAYSLTVSDSYGSSVTRGFTVTGAPAPGTFRSLPAPTRVLDTRVGTGVPKAKVPAGGVVTVQIAGVGGVPAQVAAVTLHVIATDASAAGEVTVYPSGKARPAVTDVSYPVGVAVGNLATVAVGANGKVVFHNGGSASVSLVADVDGFFVAGSPTVPGAFEAVTRTRVVDTRTGLGAPRAKVGASGRLPRIVVLGKPGLPTTAAAVVLDVTAVNGTAPGNVTAYPGGAFVKGLPTLFYDAVTPTTKLVTVPVAADGTIGLANNTGSGAVDLVADVAGYYLAGTPAERGAFVSVRTARFLEADPAHPVPAGQAVAVTVVGGQGVPASGVGTVLVDLVVVRPTVSGFLTAYPYATARPAAPSFSLAHGATTAGADVVVVGSGGRVALFNGTGAPSLLRLDVAGYYLS